MYAIMRAGRAKSTESIVLSAPYLSKMDVSNAYGVAIMLSLAKYFRGIIICMYTVICNDYKTML